MEAADQEYLGSLPGMLISTENPDVAQLILWGSLALFGLTGAAVFVRFFIRLGQPEKAEEDLQAAA